MFTNPGSVSGSNSYSKEQQSYYNGIQGSGSDVWYSKPEGTHHVSPNLNNFTRVEPNRGSDTLSDQFTWVIGLLN